MEKPLTTDVCIWNSLTTICCMREMTFHIIPKFCLDWQLGEWVGGARISIIIKGVWGYCFTFQPPLTQCFSPFRWMLMETSFSPHWRLTTKWCLLMWGAVSVTHGIQSCHSTVPGSNSGSPWRPEMGSATTHWIGAPCGAGPTVGYGDAPPSSNWKSQTCQMLAPLTSGPGSFFLSPLDFST